MQVRKICREKSVRIGLCLLVNTEDMKVKHDLCSAFHRIIQHSQEEGLRRKDDGVHKLAKFQIQVGSRTRNNIYI